MAWPRSFGWLPDRPDKRDHRLNASLFAAAPERYDMRPGCPPVYDQKSLGSCTAQAVCAVLQFTEKEHFGTKRPVPSRLFNYYFARQYDGNEGADTGAYLRTAIKAVRNFGYCDEKFWPYTTYGNMFDDEPHKDVQDIALKHRLRVDQYARVDASANALERVLADNNPIVFGFSVYEDAMAAAGKTGVYPMPNLASDSVIGGHAVVLVGYDRPKRIFIVRNSWGSRWGTKGYFTMPYNFVTDLDYCDDFWTIKAVPVVVT